MEKNPKMILPAVQQKMCRKIYDTEEDEDEGTLEEEVEFEEENACEEEKSEGHDTYPSRDVEYSYENKVVPLPFQSVKKGMWVNVEYEEEYFLGLVEDIVEQHAKVRCFEITFWHQHTTRNGT